MKENNVDHEYLSQLDYLKRLEVEWWINNLRRKINPIISEKQYYRKVSLLKRERIIRISKLNDIPHIFSDSKLLKELNKKFSPGKGGGCPVFEGITDMDVEFYYYKGTDVRCFYGFKGENQPIIKIGKVNKSNLSNKKVEIIFDDGFVEELDFHNVSRIF